MLMLITVDLLLNYFVPQTQLQIFRSTDVYDAKAKTHLVLHLMFLLTWKVKYDVNVSGFSSGLKRLPLASCVQA